MTEQHYYLDILRRLVPKSIPQHVDMSQLWRVEICAHLALIVLFVMVGWVGVYFGIIDLRGESGSIGEFSRQVQADPSGLYDLLVVLFWCEAAIQCYAFSYLQFLAGTLAFWKILAGSAVALVGSIMFFAMGVFTTDGFWFVAFGVLSLCLFGMMLLGPLMLHFLYRLISNNEDLSNL